MNNYKTKEEAYKLWHDECAALYPKDEWTPKELRTALIGALAQITTMGEEVIDQKFKQEDWKEKLKEAIIHVRMNASCLSNFESVNLARALEEFGRKQLGLTDGIFSDPNVEGSIASLRSRTEINYQNALMNIIEECAPDPFTGKYDRERQLWNVEQYARCALSSLQKFIPFPGEEEEVKNIDFFKSIAETTLEIQESTGLPNSEDRIDNLAAAMKNAYEMGQKDKSNEQPKRRTGFIRRLKERRYHNRREESK